VHKPGRLARPRDLQRDRNCAPHGVVPLAESGSAFTFTMFQAPGQPDEQFEGQYHSLLREFKNLELLFG
jgi:hypothetical protein